MLNWSFPRKDLSRQEQASQIALALRAEAADLEAAGCAILQVDEPALREGLPLKEARRAAYLGWAAAAFRLATGGLGPRVQLVSHLCYSDFAAVLPAIDALDIDVLTIENSRSDNEMLRVLAGHDYTRALGPGVYDVHSPLVPSVESMAAKLRSFLAAGLLGGDATRIWFNPDCGLKTRLWEEVVPSLRNMVAAAALVRAEQLRGAAAPAQAATEGAAPTEGKGCGNH
jgi:5-methyltetrahydropteroyltriglutamate--homocysteine methyltransferase